MIMNYLGTTLLRIILTSLCRKIIFTKKLLRLKNTTRPEVRNIAMIKVLTLTKTVKSKKKRKEKYTTTLP